MTLSKQIIEFGLTEDYIIYTLKQNYQNLLSKVSNMLETTTIL